VEARINEEADRATHYLDESTEARIVEVSKCSLLRDLIGTKLAGVVGLKLYTEHDSIIRS
jgi:hypothetical protein